MTHYDLNSMWSDLAIKSREIDERLKVGDITPAEALEAVNLVVKALADITRHLHNRDLEMRRVLEGY